MLFIFLFFKTKPTSGGKKISAHYNSVTPRTTFSKQSNLSLQENLRNFGPLIFTALLHLMEGIPLGTCVLNSCHRISMELDSIFFFFSYSDDDLLECLRPLSCCMTMISCWTDGLKFVPRTFWIKWSPSFSASFPNHHVSTKMLVV